MRFLVTGAAGFIGSHLADRLLADGHYVLGVDNFLTGNSLNFPGRAYVTADLEVTDLISQLVELDICDRQRLYRFANEFQPDVVIHCAASYSDPNLWHRDTDTNVAGTINATLVARHHGARLVYFQTALPPISSYAISKIAGEQYINLSGVPALTFRLANIYGPRNISGPIPSFYKRLAAGQACTVVDTARDMVYVDDLVWLVKTAIDSGHTGKFDVCSGTDYKIIQLYREVAAALGGLPEFAEPDVLPRPDDDVPNMDLSPLRAYSYFNWHPRTPLSEGVQAAVDWYRAHGIENTYTHLKIGAKA